MSLKPTPVTKIDFDIVPNLKKLTIFDGYEFTNGNLSDIEYHELEELYIEEGAFTSFTPTAFTKLTKLEIPFSTSLAEIDLAVNTQLTHVDCNYSDWNNNNLFSINTSTLLSLEYLSLQSNGLTYVDISNNPNLIYLDVSHNDLSDYRINLILQKLVDFGKTDGFIFIGDNPGVPYDTINVDILTSRGWVVTL